MRIGVALLRSGTDKVSVTQARDRLMKALNQQKVDKKWGMSIQAVALQSWEERKALEEARAASCEFVLYTHLTEVVHSEKFDVAAFGGQGGLVPVFSARVAYRLIRVLDGAQYAGGAEKTEGLSEIGDAVMQAIGQVAPSVMAALRKGENVPLREVTPAASTALKTFEEQMIGPDFCKWLPTDIPHAEALRGVCEYAISLPQKMPNFICDQETARYRGQNAVPRDLITALVRYEDGNESYSEIKLNGKPAPEAITRSPGLWSTGEFGSNLRAIFDMNNHPLFEFVGENAEGGRAAWVFKYRIVKQNDPLWRLHSADEMLAPPYGGELWVDQKNGDLLRFGAVARDIPASFPTQRAELSTEYDDVAFADGTGFLLPVKAAVLTKFLGEEETRNVLQFRNCHKFRAKSRMLTDVPGGFGGGEVSPAASPGSTETAGALEQNENIYAILREEAVREDAARLERERQQALQAAANEIASRLVDLEKAKREIQRREQLQQEASARVAPSLPADGLTTLKVRVNLVQVSVVLRDARGHAVGNLRKEDFQLFDGGQPQAITSFTVEGSAAGAKVGDSGSNAGAALVSPVRPAVHRSVAYVFDDIHASPEDLAGAGIAAGKHFAALPPETQAGVFTTSGQLGLNFTDDREKLAQTLKNLRPHPILRGPQCPPISQYMADLIVNQSDLEALAIATEDAQKCAGGGGLDPRIAERIAKTTAFEVISAAGAETQSTLGILREVLGRTSAQAGDRSLVLVSPGFLMLGGEVRQGVMELTDTALRSGVVVNTLDVQGLTTPLPAPNTMHSSSPVERFRFDREEEALRSEVMADLAYSTGGTFFHNNNDMDEGFRRTADAPEFIYVLGFSPQKLDGKFHKLKVTVSAAGNNGRAKLTVQARQGYYAMKPASGS